MKLPASLLLFTLELASASRFQIKQHENMKSKSTVMVCNAYPNPDANSDIHIHLKKGDEITPQKGIAYNDCKYIHHAFAFHDQCDPKKKTQLCEKLKFTSKTHTGSYVVDQKLPTDKIVMIVAYKKNADDIEEGSTSDMGFQTHIFANLMNSQVAVVDAFVGESDHVSALAVYDAQLQQGGGGNIREAHLLTGAVHAINQGAFKLALTKHSADADDKEEVVHDDEDFEKDTANAVDFVALNGRSYVAIRVGDASRPVDFPESVLVFPHSTNSQLPHSNAYVTSVFGGFVAMIFACFL